MFTQPCFIRRNTPELRKKLEELGYRCNNGKWMGEFLATFKRDDSHDLFYCGSPEYDMKNNPSLSVSIDCGTNEQLCLALAALRDDSDKNQWFVLDTDWGSVNYPESIIPKGTFIQCLVDKWNVDVLEDGSPNPMSSRNIPAHKATVEELIEHFSQSNIKERYKNLKKTKWFQDTYENKSLGDTIEIE